MKKLKFFRLKIALCVLMLACAPVASANKKIEQSKEILNDVQQRLEVLKKELDSSEEAHKDAADALKESELAISLANKKLFEINQQQQENKKTLTKLKSHSISVHQDLASQQKILSAQLYQQYIYGQQPYIQMVLQSENPSEVARNVHYYSYVAKARTALMSKMQANLDKISQLNDETANALKGIAELKQKQVEEKQTLEQQKQEKSKMVQGLSQQIVEQRGELKKLMRDEKRLSLLVERLAKIIPPVSKRSDTKRTPSGLAEAQSVDNKPAKELALHYVEPGEALSGERFSALKGKLRLPVRGELAHRFGSSREESQILWKGLFIKANEGAEVKSIATGRVVFADWLRGFGNLIILDHGEGYMSLYGNNQAVMKQVGDSVNAGDVIASVGNSGGNVTNGLYYELRRQSRPFDPLSWSRLN